MIELTQHINFENRNSTGKLLHKLRSRSRLFLVSLWFLRCQVKQLNKFRYEIHLGCYIDIYTDRPVSA